MSYRNKSLKDLLTIRAIEVKICHYSWNFQKVYQQIGSECSAHSSQFSVSTDITKVTSFRVNLIEISQIVRHPEQMKKDDETATKAFAQSNQEYSKLQTKRDYILRLFKGNYRLLCIRQEVDDYFAEDEKLQKVLDEVDERFSRTTFSIISKNERMMIGIG